MKTKTLCDWDNERIRDKSAKLVAIVKKPRYYCSKCARVAGEKKYLCRPLKLKP